MYRLSALENKYSNIFFYKTIAPTVQNFTWSMTCHQGLRIIKLGQVEYLSKMATITKDSKNNKINFYSRTAGYFRLNFGMEHEWNIGIQNYKNEKNVYRSFVTVTYFLFTSVMLLYLKVAYLNNFKQLFLAHLSTKCSW